jgi:hypothetical protein
MTLILVAVLLSLGGGYYGVTSRSRKADPCTRCGAEGYVPCRVRGIRRGLYRVCPRCHGTKEKLRYAAARHRARRAMRTVKA